jgi:pimeloyl-ACP methyl ester carboxylesterase
MPAAEAEKTRGAEKAEKAGGVGEMGEARGVGGMRKTDRAVNRLNGSLDIVGHSYGATVLTYLMNTSPGLVRRRVFIEPCVFFPRT